VPQRGRVGTSIVLALLTAVAGASGAAGGSWTFAFFAWGVAGGSLFAVAFWLRHPEVGRSTVPVAVYLVILGVEAVGAGAFSGGAAFRVGAVVTGVVALGLGVWGLRTGSSEATS
jgi:hypothetical protein